MSTACFFPKVYNEDAIDVMGKMGITHIEIFFSCLSEYKTDFVKELKKRAEFWGIHVNSIHAFTLQFEPQLFSMHDRARQEALDIYKQVVDAGAMLSADSYVFHGPANVKRARSLVLNYEAVAEKTQPLIDIAADSGIKLSWENVHWCWYAAPDFPQKLLPLLTSDNLYFTLDLKQAVQSGFDPAEYVNGAKGRLSNVHICDVKRDEQLGCIPVLPFHGSVSFDALKTSLKQNHYDGAMILEVYSHNYQNSQELLDNYTRVKTFFSE
jgi:sugar phosphate isomerase/epimerase